MKKLTRKDALLRTSFEKRELRLKITKGILKNVNLPISIRWKNSDFLDKNKNSRTKINSQCLTTNSKQILNKKFKLSRHALLREMRKGFVSGFKKSVW